MLSRVAEHLYWMARYAERAENTARLVSVNSFLLLDLPSGLAPGWEPLISITGSRREFSERHKDFSERAVTRFIIGDPHNPSSIVSCLQGARENCRAVREILPRKTWETLTELLLFARDQLNSGLTKRGRHAYLDQIIGFSQQLSGMFGSTLLRDEAYQFLRIGRNLERADMTTRIVDVRTQDLLPSQEHTDLRPFETIQWVSVLKSLTAYQMYRRRVQTEVTRKHVLNFLLTEPDLPRAFRCCLGAADDSLARLRRNKAPRRMLGALAEKVEATRFGDINPTRLHGVLDGLQLDLMRVHDSIAQTYFQLHRQPRSTWAFEVVLRPWVERW